MISTAVFAIAAAGPVSTYIRSGQDGSEAETIAVFARAPDEVHVVKMREPCTSAAYVTARLDGDTGQVLSLAGGRLTRELGQAVQAKLSREGEGALVIDAGEGSRDWHRSRSTSAGCSTISTFPNG
ncbi:hypothetical protein [Qipengyuania sphaerica]|uniref:hypothetical protein n=1 Tax=Qipengyuania sphaerica TaxID=2867243 RepID=UPI001C87197D|nr:hypothetical protein [Qipengyuania sphaerica]MBX7541623.1 hypothetical protein [Qipengyuania sphaerica]